MRNAPLKRATYEVVAAVVAFGAILLTHLSFPHLGSEPAARAAVTSLDPALLRGASKDNPCTAGQVALTFDDGPDEYTGPTLEVLRAYGVKATFFVLGSKVSRHAEVIRQIAGDGHLVENHTWDHPHLADLTPAEIDAQIAQTQQVLRTAGVPAPTMLRAPFNNVDAEVRAAARRHGLALVQWTIDTNDWRGRRAEDIMNTVLSRVRPGSVVLLHDGIQDAESTLKALPGIVEGIRERGYCTAPLA